MIPGRFHKNYAIFKPNRYTFAYKFRFAFRMFLFNLYQTPLRKILDSNIRVHLSDLFIKTREIDPHDDSKKRYVVRVYSYQPKRKQIVPTRLAASSTLRGAQKLAKEYSEISGLPFSEYQIAGEEFITLHYYGINEDLERAKMRHRF